MNPMDLQDSMDDELDDNPADLESELADDLTAAINVIAEDMDVDGQEMMFLQTVIPGIYVKAAKDEETVIHALERLHAETGALLEKHK